MEGSVLSFLKAEWKVSDTGSVHWASSFIWTYRKALFNVANDLSKEEVYKLIAIAEIQLPNIVPAIRKLEKMEAHSRCYGLFNVMEKRQVISSMNCLLLYQMLKHIKRTDLHEYIECFTGNII